METAAASVEVTAVSVVEIVPLFVLLDQEWLAIAVAVADPVAVDFPPAQVD